ncbi:hypothetical protein [Rhizobium lusitanum]|uniref:hypothetical protein n=1 Tax=Rhizobium lusitanum TaxID=293958 RepID=UPI00195E6E7B|nr:hypothetical protein [Rhizobium lusitanum]MBM7045425.1 hypothetical protein [Rhizobium lusitanum]
MSEIVERLRQRALALQSVPRQTATTKYDTELSTESADEITRLRAKIDYMLMEEEGSDAAKRELAEILSAFEPRWKHLRNAALHLIAERDSLKALCDEMAKALEPFSQEAEKWWMGASDERFIAPDTSIRLADLRAARAAISAYRKAKEVENG